MSVSVYISVGVLAGTVSQGSESLHAKPSYSTCMLLNSALRLHVVSCQRQSFGQNTNPVAS